MPDAAVATPGTSADVVIRFTRTHTPDAANNRSYIELGLSLRVTNYNGANGPYQLNGNSRGRVTEPSLGTLIDRLRTYDLRSWIATSVNFGAYEGWVEHEPDGSKTLTFTYSFTGYSGAPLGNGSGTSNLVLTTFTGSMSLKQGGAYKRVTFYLKQGGAYKRVTFYLKQGGAYKMVS